MVFDSLHCYNAAITTLREIVDDIHESRMKLVFLVLTCDNALYAQVIKIRGVVLFTLTMQI